MKKTKYKVGMVVRHKLQPEWGEGKILKVQGSTLTIDFDGGGEKQFDSRFAPLEVPGDKGIEVQDTRSDKTIKGHVEFFDPDDEYDADVIKGYVDYFAKPDKLYSLSDLEKQPPPRRPGVYGWYFWDYVLPYVSTDNCTYSKTGIWPLKTKWYLLYIGQAKSLRDRIVNYHIKGHYYGGIEISSLRLSLGCLLSDKFGLTLSYPPESFGKKEKKFNSWLEDHARVAWVELETEKLDAVEDAAIKKYTLPLNYKKNQHPLNIPLSNLKSEFRKIAKSEKHKKKQFKKAYKKFAEECESIGIKK